MSKQEKEKNRLMELFEIYQQSYPGDVGVDVVDSHPAHIAPPISEQGSYYSRETLGYISNLKEEIQRLTISRNKWKRRAIDLFKMAEVVRQKMTLNGGEGAHCASKILRIWEEEE